MVADREVLYSLADLDDHPGALVAAEYREPHHRDTAGDQVMIGMAHSRRFELDLHLVFARVADLDLLDLP